MGPRRTLKVESDGMAVGKVGRLKARGVRRDMAVRWSVGCGRPMICLMY